MLKRIKQFFLIDLPEIQTNLAILVSRKKEERTDVALMRHLLGSVDMADMAPIADLKDQARKEFAARVAVAYPDLQRIIKQLIDDQKEFALTQDGDFMFSKGTINGLYLVTEALDDWHGEHLENTKPKEDFDPHTTLPELLERYSRPAGLPNNAQIQKDNL